MNIASDLHELNHQDSQTQAVDVALIGGGIMSSTLGTLLQQLEPNWKIELFERLDDVAQESSNGWNNAGTGHSSLAESNYTPLMNDGSIDTSKAVKIYEQFQLSRQFWAYLTEHNLIDNPTSFIRSVPHFSFVAGQQNVEFLQKRFDALKQISLFSSMTYSEDPDQIKSWLPLIMEGRDPNQPIAATRSSCGTDVDFGELTRHMINILKANPAFKLNLSHDVRDLVRQKDGTWKLDVVDLSNNNARRSINAKYVFIGAGGAALKLLQQSDIPESRGYAGFPVGGQFLVTDNPEVVSSHVAKVYGKAAVGAPPMSVPHMDTRVIDGKRVLLFGPFASFSSKFLKQGSLFDLFGSITSHNLIPMLQVGLNSFDLIKYLVGELLQSNDNRMNALREFYPNAKTEDWRLWQAGQRVQIIKKDPQKGGELHLGSELVHSKDGSLIALLGASPGASVSVALMIDLLENCFSEQMSTIEWQDKIKQMLPSYGQELQSNPELNQAILKQTSKILGLDNHLVNWNSESQPVEHEKQSNVA
jgi:malate dehydrogenase (quinone)